MTKRTGKGIIATNPDINLASIEKWRRQKVKLKLLGINPDERRKTRYPPTHKTQPIPLEALLGARLPD